MDELIGQYATRDREAAPTLLGEASAIVTLRADEYGVEDIPVSDIILSDLARVWDSQVTPPECEAEGEDRSPEHLVYPIHHPMTPSPTEILDSRHQKVTLTWATNSLGSGVSKYAWLLSFLVAR